MDLVRLVSSSLKFKRISTALVPDSNPVVADVCRTLDSKPPVVGASRVALCQERVLEDQLCWLIEAAVLRPVHPQRHSALDAKVEFAGIMVECVLGRWLGHDVEPRGWDRGAASVRPEMEAPFDVERCFEALRDGRILAWSYTEVRDHKRALFNPELVVFTVVFRERYFVI